MDERTQEIVRIFQLSWQETKKWFEDLLYKHNFRPQYIKPFIDFIDKGISEGQDKSFRAGSFMHDLSFSRSIAPNLRKDQKFIKIEAFDNGLRVVFRDGFKEYRNYLIKDFEDERFTNLFATLKTALAD